MATCELTYKQHLLAQLKAAYPSLEIVHDSDKRDELKIRNFPATNINMEISGKCEVYFDKFGQIDYACLQTYWQPRLKHEGTRILFDPKKICILFDRKFPDTKKGRFEKAMWTFRVVDYIKQEISCIIEQLQN